MEKRRIRRVERGKAIIITLLLIFAGIYTARAQQVRLNASLDTSNILIGDQVIYRLHLIIPENFQFVWPQFADTLASNVEILNRSAIDTLRQSDGMFEIRQNFTLTSFDTGYYVIPPFRIQYKVNAQSGESSFIESEPFLLNVFSIPVDLAQPIKPIKGPIAVPITFTELLPWIGLFLIIAALVYYFFIRKKKTKPIAIFKPKPKQPPHVKAIAALEQLKKEKLWQQGLIKDYYSKLSGIVREYIEDQFDVPAVESTTYDTIFLMRRKSLADESLRILQELLELSDLVKFAKSKPLPSEHDRSMNNAESFVRNTAPTMQSELKSNTDEEVTTNEIIDQNRKITN